MIGCLRKTHKVDNDAAVPASESDGPAPVYNENDDLSDNESELESESESASVSEFVNSSTEYSIEYNEATKTFDACVELKKKIDVFLSTHKVQRIIISNDDHQKFVISHGHSKWILNIKYLNLIGLIGDYILNTTGPNNKKRLLKEYAITDNEYIYNFHKKIRNIFRWRKLVTDTLGNIKIEYYA